MHRDQLIWYGNLSWTLLYTPYLSEFRSNVRDAAGNPAAVHRGHIHDANYFSGNFHGGQDPIKYDEHQANLSGPQRYRQLKPGFNIKVQTIYFKKPTNNFIFHFNTITFPS